MILSQYTISSKCHWKNYVEKFGFEKVKKMRKTYWETFFEKIVPNVLKLNLHIITSLLELEISEIFKTIHGLFSEISRYYTKKA